MKRLITAFALIYSLLLCGCGGNDSSAASSSDGGITDSSQVTDSSYTDSDAADTSDLSIADSEPSQDEKPTVKEFLSAALEPCGSCLYVWSGGWNEEDTAAGIDAMTIGTSPRWREFFDLNDADYDYTSTRFQIHDGLDCTGYLGWSVYQIFGDKYSDTGYVFQSGTVIDNYLRLFGGERTPASEVDGYRAGDIMCKDGHVFIVIGQCSDKSLLFLHASPPAVSICGTPTPDGNESSEAIALAKEYMHDYFPHCYEKYDTTSRGTGYLTQYDRYRFDESVLSGQDYYDGLSPDDILDDLLGQ